jgi:hypothetical protein
MNCLLEEDVLIDALSIRTDQLHTPGQPDNVLAVIEVTIRATRLDTHNIALSG